MTCPHPESGMDYEQIIEAIRQAGGGLSRVTTATGRMSRPRCGMRRAVFPALGRALSPETGEHLAAALPQTYEPLVAEAQFRYLEIMSADQFWDRVGQPLGLGRAEALQVTGAVLETLAERIAAGQVEVWHTRRRGPADPAAAATRRRRP